MSPYSHQGNNSIKYMTMKTFVRQAVLSAMGLSAMALAGCSKASLDTPVAPVGERVEITLGAEVASTAKVKAGLSRGVVDKGSAGPLFVSFARIDQDETTGKYPVDYSDVDSAFVASWKGTLASADGSATAIKFYDPKFYLSRASNNSTKLVGWYPQTAFKSGSNGVIEIAVNGSNDIMLTEELEGSKDKCFGTYVSDGDAGNRIFHFRHQLTQLRFFAYGVDAAAPGVWGKIKSIKLKEQLPTCEITLPATVAFIGTAAHLALVKKKASGDANIDYGTDGLEFSFDSSVAADGDEQANREKSATECGYAMVAPIAAGGKLTLIIETEKGGERDNIAVSLPADGFKAGFAYNIYLRFSAITIEPKAAISEWQTGGNVNIEM